MDGRRFASISNGCARLRRELPIPLVLHGASSIDRDDLEAAIGLGIRKINVGSALKQAFFDAVRRACLGVDDRYNPYEVIGSGLEADILVQGGSRCRRLWRHI